MGLDYSKRLKKRIKENSEKMALKYSLKGKEYDSAYVYEDIAMNFNKESYCNIMKNENWKTRLNKEHNFLKEDNTLEMQSSNSSDALLMNIFCFPKINNWKGLKNLLEVENFDSIEFGWNPFFKNEKIKFPTEIDMKINKTIFEAKLTETDFTRKEKTHVELYENFNKIFEKKTMKVKADNYLHYQLIRNVLTAYKYNLNFILLLDESRTDLIKYLFEIILSIKDKNLREKIRFLTWQEIVYECGKELRYFIEEKYF